MEADVAASPTWDPRVQLPGPVGFEAIPIVVHMQADAPPDTLHALIARALVWSPLANTLHDPVHLDMTLGRTTAMDAEAPVASGR